MASTEPRAGFRPPWALDSDPEETTPDVSGETVPEASAYETSSAEAIEPNGAVDSADTVDAMPEPIAAEAAPVEEVTPVEQAGPAPTKFQVDLARAMRAAAETARAESLERLAADAKTRIEGIRTDSSGAATELRQRADDDIAEVREWSKGELARIRSEADAKISDRKSWLEQEMQAHEDGIETRVGAVSARVTAFEAQLEAFFERLAAETDPTRIAAIAQTLPDVPALDDEAIASPSEAWASVAETEAAAPVDSAQGDSGEPDPDNMTVEEMEAEPFDAMSSRLAALGFDPGAIQAAETEATSNLESADWTVDAVDAAVEASADESAPVEATTDTTASNESEPTASPEPETAVATDAPSATSDSTETTVVVDGLISVASIAGFKRHLSRLAGVAGVTVTSGPEGEFIFAVTHDPGAAIQAELPGISGFGVRIVDAQAGTIRVAAHDPEQTSDASLDAVGRR